MQQDPPPDSADPVEVVAWIMRDHRITYNDPGGPLVDDDDRAAARRALAALVAGPWHLVTYEPDGGLFERQNFVSDGRVLTRATITQEWRP